MARVLIIDDEAGQRNIMCSILHGENHELFEAESVDAGLKIIGQQPPAVVLTDLKMPGRGGLELVEALQSIPFPPEVVVITAYGSVETAVRAMRLGAYHYLTKPIERDELVLVVQRAAEKYALRQSAGQLRDELAREAQSGIVAESTAMKLVVEMARKVAENDATVLIRGETGTGKERIARLIHYLSARGGRPMQCINCAAFPESLLESELFGHEKGAFTGAHARRAGIVEAADGGTLFLDEVGDMTPSTQAKILRVLQEKEVRRLGSTAVSSVNIRFIAATNKNLEEAIKSGTFREDLFYRLNIIPVVIPPLRQRREDIPALANSFLLRRCGHGREFTSEALECLRGYGWPGNVRELEAVVERVALLSSASRIAAHDLPPEIRSPSPPAFSAAGGVSLPASGIVFEQWERSLLEQALQRTGGVMTEAAKLLGMTYRTFQYRAEKFGLTDFG